jgi:hypothetical protein
MVDIINLLQRNSDLSIRHSWMVNLDLGSLIDLFSHLRDCTVVACYNSFLLSCSQQLCCFLLSCSSVQCNWLLTRDYQCNVLERLCLFCNTFIYFLVYQFCNVALWQASQDRFCINSSQIS